VLIEAYIVEAGTNVARELGVQWGGAYQLSGGDKRGFVTGRDNSTTSTTSNSNLDRPVDPATGTVWTCREPYSRRCSHQLRFRLPKHRQDASGCAADRAAGRGQAHDPLSPSITTLDNQMAMIESGRDVPFQTVEDGEVNIDTRRRS